MKHLLFTSLFMAVFALIQAASLPAEEEPSNIKQSLQQMETLLAVGQQAYEILQATDESESLMLRIQKSLGKVKELSDQVEQAYYSMNFPVDTRFDYCVNITFSIAKAERLLLDGTRLVENIQRTAEDFMNQVRTKCNTTGIIRRTMCILNLFDDYLPDYAALRKELTALLEKAEYILEEVQQNISKCFSDASDDTKNRAFEL